MLRSARLLERSSLLFSGGRAAAFADSAGPCPGRTWALYLKYVNLGYSLLTLIFSEIQRQIKKVKKIGE